MEEPKVPREYTKSEAITLYSFWFSWTTIVTTVLSILCGILPSHFIAHILLQVSIYVIFYKMCKYSISKGITADMSLYGSNENYSFHMKKSMFHDMSPSSDSRDSITSNSLTSTQYRMVRDIW